MSWKQLLSSLDRNSRQIQDAKHTEIQEETNMMFNETITLANGVCYYVKNGTGKNGSLLSLLFS